MKISAHFELGGTQHEIDFVDIDIENDTPLFIDPHFLGLKTDAWSRDAAKSVRSPFRHFLTLGPSGDQATALPASAIDKRPNIPLDRLVDEAAVERFLNILSCLVSELRRHAETVGTAT